MKKILTWSVFIISTVILTAYLYNLDPSTPFQAFFTACFVSGALALIVPCVYKIKWRYDNGVDLFATLETNEAKLKEHMLFIMRHHGVEENLTELNEIFRNYPQWHLEDWEVFRAWYKAQIDHMMKYPDIYGLTLKGSGEPYDIEKDRMYDPEAPDWDQFDIPRCDDDDNDFEDSGNDDKKSKASDALAVGIGVGIVNGLTGGSVFGGGSGGN